MTFAAKETNVQVLKSILGNENVTSAAIDVNEYAGEWKCDFFCNNKISYRKIQGSNHMNLYNTCNSKENVELAQGDNDQIKGKKERGEV